MIVSFIMRKATGAEKPHPIEEFKEFLRENAIKLFVGMVLIVTIGTMLTAGLYMTLMSLTAQADLGLSPRMTSMTWAGLIMALIPVFILSFAWYKSSPPEARPKRRHVQEGPATLEQALALLVTDFVEERQMKREFKYERERRMAEAEKSAGAYGASHETFERH